MDINFKIENKTFRHTFYITHEMNDTDFCMILGADFLAKFKLILDLNKNVIMSGSREFKLKPQIQAREVNNRENLNTNINEQTRIKECFAINKKKVILRPGEAKIVTLKSTGMHINNTEVIFEKLHNNKAHEELSTHIIQNNELQTILFNESLRTLHFNKGQKMGTLTTNFVHISEQETQSINAVLSQEEILELRKEELKESDFDVSHLDPNFQREVLDFMLKNYKVFSKSYKTLGMTDAVVPEMKLRHNYPIQLKPYPLPRKLIEVADREISELIEAGIFKESTSNYAFPIIMVRKKDSNKFRATVDFRLLNEIMELYKVAVPRIKEVIQDISGFKHYTTLDLKSAFFQICLPPHLSDICTVITHRGNYSMTRLPFGTKVSSQFFIVLMNKVLEGISTPGIKIYIDDIIIGANSKQELKEKMQLIFDRLQKYNLTIDPSKVQLFKNKIDVLGYEVSEKGIRPADANVKKIKEFKRPTSIKQVKSLLGLLNFFRHLIKDYATKVKPLIALTKQNVKFKWTEDTEKAFQELQREMVNKPTLYRADMNKKFYLISDASSIAIGAVLSQKNDKDQLIPIEYYSRTLSETESRYPSWKTELYAVFKSVTHFRDYLFGTKFVLYTDAAILKGSIDLSMQSPCVIRWILQLQSFDMEIQHIAGKNNPADYLSREVFTIQIDPISNLEIIPEEVKNMLNNSTPLNTTNINKHQTEDPETQNIIRALLNKDKRKSLRKFFIDKSTGLLMVRNNKGQKLNGRKFRIYVPTQLRNTVLTSAHNSHFGRDKLNYLINRCYFWPGMTRDIAQFCEKCELCFRKKKVALPPVALRPMDAITQNGEVLALDITGPLPKSQRGHKYILTMIDLHSCYLTAYPLKITDARQIIAKITEYVCTFGIPHTFLFDNGPQFKCQEVHQFIESIGARWRHTSTYSPSSNGRIERRFLTIKNALSCMTVNTRNWDTMLPWSVLYHNTAENSTTKVAPIILYFGRDVKLPGEPTLFQTSTHNNLHKDHKKNLEFCKKIFEKARRNREKLEAKYPHLHRKFRTLQLKVGDQVFLKRPEKFIRTFENKWEGPYTIRNIGANQALTLQDKNGATIKQIHPRRVRKFNNGNNDTTTGDISVNKQTTNAQGIQGNSGIRLRSGKHVGTR